MPDADAVLWLLPAVVAAGLIRGFAGFGAALIFVPIAARVLPPAEVVVVLLIMDGIGQIPLLPRALREGGTGATWALCFGGFVGIPIGVYFLAHIDPTIFRWIASSFALAMLAALVSGWRYPGRPGAGLSAGIGATGGFLSGFVGIGGPPVILFLLGGPEPPARVRATIILYFAATGVMVALALAHRGLLEAGALVLGAAVAGPYLLAISAGTWAYAQWGTAQFRRVAFVAVGGAAISGLPIFDGGV